MRSEHPDRAHRPQLAWLREAPVRSKPQRYRGEAAPVDSAIEAGLSVNSGESSRNRVV